MPTVQSQVELCNAAAADAVNGAPRFPELPSESGKHSLSTCIPRGTNSASPQFQFDVSVTCWHAFSALASIGARRTRRQQCMRGWVAASAGLRLVPQRTLSSLVGGHQAARQKAYHTALIQDPLRNYVCIQVLLETAQPSPRMSSSLDRPMHAPEALPLRSRPWDRSTPTRSRRMQYESATACRGSGAVSPAQHRRRRTLIGLHGTGRRPLAASLWRRQPSPFRR